MATIAFSASSWFYRFFPPPPAPPAPAPPPSFSPLWLINSSDFKARRKSRLSFFSLFSLSCYKKIT
jgi:hypothetical protein